MRWGRLARRGGRTVRCFFRDGRSVPTSFYHTAGYDLPIGAGSYYALQLKF